MLFDINKKRGGKTTSFFLNQIFVKLTDCPQNENEGNLL